MTQRSGPNAPRGLPQYSLPRNSPCLCGSGLTFKRCCADRLPGAGGVGRKVRPLLKAEEFREALYAARADVTQYTIWHKSHTEPALRIGMPKVGMFEIDLRALAELVDTLMWCHIKTDQMDEFPAVLERLRGNIKDIAWQRKIIYFHAMHALWPDWNEAAGRRELKKLGPIDEDYDIETLQLYLDLFGESLSFSQKLDLINRIISLSRNLSDQLHYRGARAVLFFTIGDTARAEEELTKVIEDVRAERDPADLDDYERYRLALTLDALGSIRPNKDTLGQAVELIQGLLKGEGLTPKYRAHLLGQLGTSYKHMEEWKRAKEALEQSLALEPSEILRVFLSDCYLGLGLAEEAARMSSEVDVGKLSPAEQVDHAFSLAAIAIETGERERLETAKAVLKDISVSDPLFRERRDACLLNVQEALTLGTSKSLVERTRRIVSKIAGSAASYLILKPSFMGIGIDIGKIFEDLSKRQNTTSPSKSTDREPPAPNP
jgi:tetratricopeptide (TPR) repeat protein